MKKRLMTELFYHRIISRYFFLKIKFTLQWLGWFQLAAIGKKFINSFQEISLMPEMLGIKPNA
jgi:hypothetical protein